MISTSSFLKRSVRLILRGQPALKLVCMFLCVLVTREARSQNWSSITYTIRATRLLCVSNSDQGGLPYNENNGNCDWRGSITFSDNVNTSPSTINASAEDAPISDFMPDQNFASRTNKCETINLRLDALEYDYPSESLDDNVTTNVTSSFKIRSFPPTAPGFFDPASIKNWGRGYGNGGYFDATVGCSWAYAHSASDYLLEPSLCPSLYTETYPASTAPRIPCVQLYLHAGTHYRFDNITSDNIFDLDSELRLYAPDGYSEVAYNDNYGEFALQSRIDDFVPAITGIYYLEISSFLRTPFANAFSLNITSLDVVPPVANLEDIFACNYAAAPPTSELPNIFGLYDNCTGNPLFVFNGESPGSTTYPAFYVRDYSLSDAFGNVSTIFQTIQVGNVDAMLASGIQDVNGTLTLGALPDAGFESSYSFQWYNCSEGFSPIEGATSPTFTPTELGSYSLSCSYSALSTGDFCQQFTDCFQVVGVDELADIRKMLVYPNPVSSGMVFIQCADDVESVLIFNLLGQEVYSSTQLGQKQIDISTLSSGHYIVKVRTDSGYYTENLIVIHQ